MALFSFIWGNTMKNGSLVDMTRFEQSDIDDHFINYRLSWQQVLLIVGDPQNPVSKTLVLTVSGRLLKINQPLRIMIKEFFDRHDLDDDHNWAYYQYCSLQGRTRSAVAGRYRMVPTCSPRSRQVYWIMAHHLNSWHKHERGTLLIFASDGQPSRQLQVLLDVSPRKLESNLAAADIVSAFQLQMLEYEQYLKGSELTSIRPDDFARLNQLQEQSRGYNITYQQRRWDHCNRNVYGEGLADEMLREMNKPFPPLSPY